MRKIAVALGLVLMSGALVAPATAAAAPTWTASTGARTATSPLSGFSHLIVDPDDARVFVSEGSSGKLGVFDTFDHPITTLSGLADPTGLALSPDHSTLFVAESEADAVIAVDTKSLQVTATYQLATGSCPVGLTWSADLLWVGESAGCRSGDATLGAIDTATGDVYNGVSDGPGPGESPVLTSSEALPNVVIAQSSGRVFEFDVTSTSGGTAPTAVEVATTSICEIRSMAMTPGGSGLLIACGSPYHHILLSTADLGQIGTYPSTEYPNAAAIRGDGLVAAGVDAGRPSIWLYTPGQTARYSSYSFGAAELESDGLAFGTSHLFAVTWGGTGHPADLRMMNPKRRPTLTIGTEHTQYAYAAKVRIVTQLGNYGDGNPVVSIYATPNKGTPKFVARGKVNADGTFVTSVRASVNMTFTATFTGDAQTLSVQAKSRMILVKARVHDLLQGYYAESGVFRLYHVSQNPVETVTVSPSKPGVCVYFHFEWYINGAWGYDETTPCVRLDQESQAGVRLVGTHEVGERVRVRAMFRGGALNLAANGDYRYIKFTK